MKAGKSMFYPKKSKSSFNAVNGKECYFIRSIKEALLFRSTPGNNPPWPEDGNRVGAIREGVLLPELEGARPVRRDLTASDFGGRDVRPPKKSRSSSFILQPS